MKRATIVLIIIVFMLVMGVFGGGFYIYRNILNINTIYKGVKIDGYDVGGKTKEQALEYIRGEKDKDLNKLFMNLSYGESNYRIRLRQLGFSYKYKEAVEAAYKLGREGNFFRRLRDIGKVKSGVIVPLESFYRAEAIEDIVKSISQEINRDAKDAVINFNNGKFSISEEIVGKRVVEEDLYTSIENNIYSLKPIEIPVRDIKPRLTKALLSRINGVIGEFFTSFSGSSRGRIENIKLSAEAISNKLVLPGEEFSYNNTTGPRSAESGYKEANVIIGGEFTPGVGGGVCQTSTTMYNALLLADLTILQRHPHSIPATYVPFGQDAAVSYGYLDLKFRNDFDFPIYTYAKVVGNRLHVYIYGDTNAKDYTVKIEPQIVETIHPKTEEIFDENLQPGEKIDIQVGRTGYKVVTYKSIIKNGKLISKKEITQDTYRKRDHIYKIGPE